MPHPTKGPYLEVLMIIILLGKQGARAGRGCFSLSQHLEETDEGQQRK